MSKQKFKSKADSPDADFRLIQAHYRQAIPDDLQALIDLEQQSFKIDRLSRRSLRRWISAEHSILLVAEIDNRLVGYGLVWLHKGTRLARIYSLAVAKEMRGKGIAAELIAGMESSSRKRGHFFMRLEVSKKNTSAISLYEKYGYRVFGEYNDYYEDHSDALRMQKLIRGIPNTQPFRLTPWYEQTTDFTCGPAALLMAMASFEGEKILSQTQELNIWREATTIFMTSGHGGSHPVGLGLAANARDYEARVFLNTHNTVFLDGVRSSHKKDIMTVVHDNFVSQAKTTGVEIVYREVSQQDLITAMEDGYAVLVLISTYRLDGKKSPHWVTLVGVDDDCLYVHDPDPDQHLQAAIDCQYLPIAREDFAKMTSFGSSKLRTAVAIKPRLA